MRIDVDSPRGFIYTSLKKQAAGKGRLSNS
jgi:hypothetical protein